MTDNYADVNGVRLHYVSAGGGPLILFLHGFPEFWYAWKAQLAHFGKSYFAVAPDMRGYNLSGKPSGVDSYGIKLLVEDVRALAAHLGYEKFTLVGHDWGGAVAWAFAIAHPECLDKLVIINAPHPGVFRRLLSSDPDQQTASQYMLLFRSDGAEASLSADGYALLVRIVLEAGLSGGVFTEEDKQAYLAAWAQPGALSGGLNYYRAAGIGPGGSGEVDVAAVTVRVPALVIWGEKDKALITKNVDGLPEFVPDLTVRRIADATHWVVHERANEVNRHIEDFLRI